MKPLALDYSTYNKQNKLHGYWLSYDSDNHISCGAIILSKVKMNQQEVVSEMKDFSLNCENLLLQICK